MPLLTLVSGNKVMEALTIIDVVLFVLAATFFLGAALHLLNLFRLKSSSARAIECGSKSATDEFFHIACFASMAAALVPGIFPVPDIVWIVLFPICFSFCFLRALFFSSEKKLGKHSLLTGTMLLGMWVMFAFPSLPQWLTITIAFYWSGMVVYYLVGKISLNHSIHLLMCLTMVLMTVWPHTFMPHHGHHKAIQSTLDLPTTSGVMVLTDDSYGYEVTAKKGRVIVLVYGGCENCSKEVRVFDELAGSICGTTRFARINKDSSPEFVSQFKIDDCPRFLLFEDGKLVDTLEQYSSEQELAEFMFR